MTAEDRLSAIEQVARSRVDNPFAHGVHWATGELRRMVEAMRLILNMTSREAEYDASNVAKQALKAFEESAQDGDRR